MSDAARRAACQSGGLFLIGTDWFQIGTNRQTGTLGEMIERGA